MSGVAEAFERLVAALQGRGSTIRSYLNPGAGSAQVAEALRAAGAGVHPDVVELYGWHDGTDLTALAAAAPPPELVPALDFLPLLAGQPGFDTSISRFRSYGDSPPTPVDQGGWPPTWYPLFVYGPDVAVDTDTGQLWLYAWPWYHENRFVAGSLAEFAELVVRNLDDGTWVLDGCGVFSEHDLY